MRVFAVAMLLLSSSVVPSFAQDEGKSSALSQPQTTPVQPELTPQKSDQAKEQNRQRAEDTRVTAIGERSSAMATIWNAGAKTTRDE